MSKRREKYIAGIFNYCDRWCERCPFKARCRSFAMEQAMRRREARRDAENAAFWAAMEKAAGDALEDLKKQAAELAPKAETFEDESYAPRLDRSEKHPLVVEATKYGMDAHRWFERRQAEFFEGRDKLDPILADAADIVLWYHLFMSVKLSRAIFGRTMHEEMEDDDDDDEEEEEEDEDDWDDDGEPVPSDADGSAKVAIIAIDRSITAWAILMERRPREAKQIRSFLHRLLRLRGWADREFPEARAFIKPGFDDGTAT